uniref:ABC transmembrane type-1 domain-containing protein n=1 Tax=Chenopodium quinoa TaxID=63459 RepID=A0A803MUN0_CHEQI
MTEQQTLNPIKLVENGAWQLIAAKESDVSIKRLASLKKPEIPTLVLGCLSAIVLDAIGLAVLLSYPARTYFFAVAGCKLIQRLRMLCFERVVHMEIGWFDEPENASGAVGARLSTDAASVRALVGDALGLLVQNISSGVTGLEIAFLVFFALAMAAVGISQTSSFVPDTSKAKSATASVFSILDRKPMIDSSDESGATIDQVKGDIQFKNVRFTYPTRPDIEIFQDLNLTINAGQNMRANKVAGCSSNTQHSKVSSTDAMSLAIFPFNTPMCESTSREGHSQMVEAYGSDDDEWLFGEVSVCGREEPQIAGSTARPRHKGADRSPPVEGTARSPASTV